MIAVRRPALVLFCVAAVGYLATAVLLARHGIFLGDALARVASASSALHGQHPGLSSLGFVFPPLTAIVQLPLVAFSPIVPWLTEDGLSAAIVSALFAAGAVVQLDGIARDRGTAAAIRVPVVAVFALNPMIVFYAANGMSEAPYLCLLLWAVRRLLRWVDTDDVHELVVAGIALALAYLTRYDGAAATMAAGFAVFAVTWRRARRGHRFGTAVMDLVLVSAPAAASFVMWAVASWMITGDLFAQFSSRYGNSAILAQTGGSTADVAPIVVSTMSFLILAPTLPVVVVCAMIARRRRLLTLLMPVAVFGAVLAFQTFTYLRGGTFGFLRFTIVAIPLAAVLAILAAPARRAVPVARSGPRRPVVTVPGPGARPRLFVPTVAVLALITALPATVVGMGSPTFAPQEFVLRAVLARTDATGPALDQARRTALAFATERRIAQYLDAMHLPRASVAVDTASGFAIIARSRNPLQFLETADPAFTQAVNAPARHGIRYLLAVPPTGRGEADALNLRYPTLFANGGGVGELEIEARNEAPDQPDWRLYRVLPAVDD